MYTQLHNLLQSRLFKMIKQKPSITSNPSTILDTSIPSQTDWKALYEKEHQLTMRLQTENQALKIKYQAIRDKKAPNLSICQKCSSQQPKKTLQNLKSEFQMFSKQIEKKIKVNVPNSAQDISATSFQQIEQQKDLSNKQIPFIQNFAVLGIPDETISNFRNVDQHELQGGVVLSVREATAAEGHAANFAVPSGMTLKTISGEKIFAKATKLMSSSYNKQHTFLLTFEPKEGRFNNLSNDALQLLNLLNPSRKLFCLCVGTYDFTYIKKQFNQQNFTSSHSFEISRQSSTSNNLNSSGFFPNYSDVHQISRAEQIGISQRVYCIMSYFPFFSFFADILLAMLNIIKVERLDIYRHRIEDLKKIDSRFQIARLKKIYSQFLKKFNKQPVRLNMVYHLNLLNQNPLLSTLQKSILYSESEEWDFQVLSLFNLNTFIDIITLFLLEDKLFFVCDQSRILTYTVYLVSTYLCRPFKSAFPSVCILPKQQQFLNAPFPGAYGILKKKDWINQRKILQRFRNTYVFMDPSQIKIAYTESKDDILEKRPKKLKKQLAPLFQEIKKRKEQKRKLLKYQSQQTEYNWHSDRQDRDIVIKILQTVRRYLFNEVWKFIPSTQVLRKIKSMTQKQPIPERKDSHTFLIDQLILYIIQERNNKDPFVEHLLRTQMLSVHLSELIDQLQKTKQNHENS